MGFAVLPMGRNMVLVDMDAGLLFFFAMGAATEVSVFMAGWSSRNKYSLLGAMRGGGADDQLRSGAPALCVSVVMIAGSLSLTKIVAAQNSYTGIFPHWYIFTPWGAGGFLMYAIAGTAETNRSPFDLPEGESELSPVITPSTPASSSRSSFSANTCHVFHLRVGRHALSRRLVRAFLVSRIHSFVDLVLRQGA
jgi:NADH:ubiquinone oxidoreductase subunit H